MAVEHHELEACKERVEERMDNRLSLLEAQLLGMHRTMQKDVDVIKADVEHLVTRPEFEPVKLIAFGLAGGALIAVIGALMGLILR